MSDSTFTDLGDSPPSRDEVASSVDAVSTEPAAPQFGLLEVIEAFTAMRHEFRTQSREHRPLADSITTAADSIRRIESTLDEKLAAAAGETDAQSLLEIIIDLDISLQRAADATANRIVESESQQTELVNSVRRLFDQSGWMGRWFGKRFFNNVIQTIQANDNPKPDSTADGIRMLVVRLRRMMAEKGVQRTQTLGQPFDAETMKAISTVASDNVSVGSVAEEISPAYFYQTRLVRFAEVKVAKAV